MRDDGPADRDKDAGYTKNITIIAMRIDFIASTELAPAAFTAAAGLQNPTSPSSAGLT
jgi:hypothetical protein